MMKRKTLISVTAVILLAAIAAGVFFLTRPKAPEVLETASAEASEVQPTEAPEATAPAETATAQLTKAPEQANTEAPAQAEEITIPVIGDLKKFAIPENDAMALLKDMKCGWNLGNTFDAYSGYTVNVSGTAMETSWVGVKTTEKLIAAIKEAGFNTIRIPVSWHNHVDKENVINAEWLARVKEVAGWALDQGMYVIVNVHHDNDVNYFYPDATHIKRSSEYLSAVWTQMAEAFKECDDHLILESMNEPRLVGTAYEWNWSSSVSDCRLAATYINQLNQLFVDTVRASGGNNATRYLAVPAYCAAPWNASDQAFQLPKDTADNRIIVSAHAYTPYNFALNLQSNDKTFDLEKDQSKKSEIANFLNSLYNRFIVNGVPVMMDEFGALDKGGNTQDRVNFTAYYVASASARGITCVWWDNHAFAGTGERFGLIKRQSCTWVYPEIVQAIMANCLYNR
jgi:endoglucanase